MSRFIGEIHIMHRASDNWKYEPIDDDGNRVLRVRTRKYKEKQFDYLSNLNTESQESLEHESENDEGENDE
jgi:hypothetical protein